MTYEEHSKKFKIGMIVNFLFIGCILFSMPVNILLGIFFLIGLTIYSFYFAKQHNERLELLAKIDPCHAVFGGDSYFFNTMTVEDGYFNRGEIYKDDDGLYVYKENSMSVGLSNETDGVKVYLQKHVQEKYLNYLSLN